MPDIEQGRSAHRACAYNANRFRFFAVIRWQ